jgi:hypothetical protein
VWNTERYALQDILDLNIAEGYTISQVTAELHSPIQTGKLKITLFYYVFDRHNHNVGETSIITDSFCEVTGKLHAGT